MKSLPRTEKIKVIANFYYMQGIDERSHMEVLSHMQDWASKGHLNPDWIDFCYDAIEANEDLVILYEPGKYYNGFYAPSGA